jgi:hypothetical protein
MDNMLDMQEVALRIQKVWAGLTLETLHEEAIKELNGTCFRSIRAGTGPGWRLYSVLLANISCVLRPN